MQLDKTKSDIYNNIKVFTSLRDSTELSDKLDIIEKMGDKKNPLNFIITLLIMLSGIEVIKNFIANFLISKLSELEDEIKDVLKCKYLLPGNEQNIPSVSYSIPIRSLDKENLYKIAPSSLLGQKLYHSDANTFDKIMYNVVSTGSSSDYFGVDENNINHKIFSLNASNGKDLIVTLYGDLSIENFKNYFINSMKIFDKKIFINEVMNNLFGLFDKGRKSKEQLTEEEKMNLVIQKMMNDEEDEKIFVFKNNELKEIEKLTLERLEGVKNLNLICGQFPSELKEETLLDLSDAIVNGEIIDVENKLDNTFNSSINEISINPSAAKEGFFRRLFNIIGLMIVKKAFFTPQMRLLNFIMKKIKNGDDIPNSETNYAKENKELIKSIVNRYINKMGDFLLPILKKELKRILVPAFKKIIKNQIKKRINLLRSLTVPI